MTRDGQRGRGGDAGAGAAGPAAALVRSPRAAIDDFLAQRTLALAGARRDGKGFGNVALRELLAKGFDVRLVHPEARAIGGRPCASSVAAVAGEVGGLLLTTPPDITERLVEEAIAAGVRRVWMQQGAASTAAVRACEAAGVSVVHGECVLMFAEPAMWVHRLHRWLRRIFGRMPG